MQVSRGARSQLILPVLQSGSAILAHYSQYAINLHKVPNLSLLADRCMCMKQVHQVHAQMIVSARIQDNYAASRIMAFCALSDEGDLSYALRLFYHTFEPNSFMWNTIIRAHALSPTPHNAILLYKHMKMEGIMPGKHTFPFLLKACTKAVALSSGQQVHAHVLQSGFEFDIHVANALLHMYACSGGLDCARRFFDNMPVKNVIVWTTMINGYAQNCFLDSALSLFNEMVEAGIKPNEVTLCSVLSSCAKLGNLELGEHIHAYIKREKIQIGVILGTSLIDMYAKNGRIEIASKLFGNMPERNSATWNALICGMAMHGHAEKSLHLYLEMRKEDAILPNDITFVGVLSACCHAGLIDVGQEVFNSMYRDYGVRPKLEHYGCMVDLLGRSGRLREAEELIGRMDMRPDVVVLGALLGACKMHGNIEIAERVVKQMLKVEPHNHGVYVVLSNMYAEVGKWEVVMRLRKIMKAEGLKKLPGFSLVEANK
ncbi:unnamed protein product [Victoria cruziana]